MAPVCFVIRGQCQEMQNEGGGWQGRGAGCLWLGSVDGQRKKEGRYLGWRRKRGGGLRRRRKDEIREQLRARAEEGGL